MAIDTRDKRASVAGHTLPFLVTAPTPDGTIGDRDRQHVGSTYRGLALEGSPPAGSGGKSLVNIRRAAGRITRVRG